MAIVYMYFIIDQLTYKKNLGNAVIIKNFGVKINTGSNYTLQTYAIKLNICC